MTVIEIYFHQWDKQVGADLDALTKVTTSALVLAGRHDGITSPKLGAERIAELLPNAGLKVF